MNAQWLARKLAMAATRSIGVRWGEFFPFYYVSEYPKSGGAWLAQMVGDYLQLPFPRHMVLPLGFSCVIQNHWRYHPGLKRVFYLYRDGRDVITSFYFHHVRMTRHVRGPGAAHVRRTYERLFGKGYDAGDAVAHLPRFIEHEFAHPGRGTSLNWCDHIEDWDTARNQAQVAHVSYEQLQDDCAGTLCRAIEKVSGESTDPWRLETTVEKMSMRRQTGREPGHSDVTQHVRKGIVGDWRNYFSREAADVFHHVAGDTLVRLGYESDPAWVDRYEYPTP